MRLTRPAVSRRLLTSLSVLAVPLALAVVPLPKTGGVGRVAEATPVADSDELYTVCGRVFPDPQAFGPSPTALPGESPYAKGNAACRATQFIQHAEAISGLNYLEERYPDFVEVYDLSTDFPDVLDADDGEGMTAGIPTPLLTREKSPLTLVRVTDEKSSIPEKKKEHFVFPLSIHGIERAGIEGGLRALEDLATWGAETPEQPVMETLEDSLPTGEVLKKASVYFVLANPDGWRRGDVTGASPFYQRFNGNGVDMNRDWPAKGWTFKPFTPWSEPETRSFGKVLKSIKSKWTGGIDLHGQLIDRAFSFTLLGGSQRPYGKNERVLQFTRGAWADAETRLAWNPLIKSNDTPESCVPAGTSGTVNDPQSGCDPTNRIYGVQWGTIWDTINYTVTGAFGDWIDSPLGLDADGIDNEMSLSHLSNCGVGTCYIQTAEQLHVDGNKSLIYSMLNYSLLPEDQVFRYAGRAAYLTHGKRLREAERKAPVAPTGTTPQDDLSAMVNHTGQAASTYEFEVEPPSATQFTGGARVRLTFPNVQGIGPGSTNNLAVEREVDGEWVEVEKAFNQSSVPYAQSGLQAELNFPPPGNYRAVITGGVPGPIALEVEFTKGPAWPAGGQAAVDASNIDFFDELKPFLESPGKLTAVSPADIKSGKVNLRTFDTLIGVDETTIGTDKALAMKALDFVKKGGNLVLTDDALRALSLMGLVPDGGVSEQSVYAGNVEFQRDVEGELEVTYADPLAANVDQPGAAEGPNNRHQVVEPVPIGYALTDDTGADTNTQPQWTVATEDFEGAGGRVVGRLGAAETTFGEIELGDGQIRVLGALLPFPTAEFDHRYGLSDYALTYSGYELAKNMFSHVNPNGGTSGPLPRPTTPPKPRPTAAPRPTAPGTPLVATGGEAPWAAVLLGVLGMAVAVRTRRTRVAAR